MQIENLQPQEFDAFFALLEESFPTDEYRPYAEQKALFDNPLYTVCVVRDDAGDLLAAIALWRFESFWYVEHFAVAPAARNKGLGSRFLTALLKKTPLPVCLEVEPPNTPLACRRIGFYERNGFFYNDYPYMQPPISAGRNAVLLQIMTAKRGVDRAEFEHMKATLYREVYHCI